jgi:hypothetical protein
VHSEGPVYGNTTDIHVRPCVRGIWTLACSNVWTIFHDMPRKPKVYCTTSTVIDSYVHLNQFSVLLLRNHVGVPHGMPRRTKEFFFADFPSNGLAFDGRVRLSAVESGKCFASVPDEKNSL